MEHSSGFAADRGLESQAATLAFGWGLRATAELLVHAFARGRLLFALCSTASEYQTQVPSGGCAVPPSDILRPRAKRNRQGSCERGSLNGPLRWAYPGTSRFAPTQRGSGVRRAALAGG